ncbi:unnamed protein product, partial [Iphiclides podalirius]
MGCPLGSYDDLLEVPKPVGVSMIAYVDDVTIVIESSSRADIERKATTVLTVVSEWRISNRLTDWIFLPDPECSMRYVLARELARALERGLLCQNRPGA